MVSLFGHKLFSRIHSTKKPSLIERVEELADLESDNFALNGINMDLVPDPTLVCQEFFMPSSLCEANSVAGQVLK